MFVALSYLKGWLHRKFTNVHKVTQPAHPGVELVCELSRKMDCIIKDPAREIISKYLAYCVHMTYLGGCKDAMQARLDLEEALRQ